MLVDLVAEYPDARVVMTHRRPVRTLASLSSLQVRCATKEMIRSCLVYLHVISLGAMSMSVSLPRRSAPDPCLRLTAALPA